MSDAVAVVLAGGRGVRLWPLSRNAEPKQFQPVVGAEPLLEQTLSRLEQVFAPDDIFVSTTVDLLPSARRIARRIPAANFIVEASGRRPATALALAHLHIRRARGDVCVLSCPSDHDISDATGFAALIRQMIDDNTSEPEIPGVFAVPPRHPSTSLGYFISDEPVSRGSSFLCSVLEEKPEPDRAGELADSGRAYWNTACYAVRTDTFIAAYSRYAGAVIDRIEEFLAAPADTQLAGYDGPVIPGHELDPLMAAGAVRVYVDEIGWSDVGTWENVHDARRASGTDLTAIDAEGTVAISTDGRPIIVAGVRNARVVAAHDAVFVIDGSLLNDPASVDRLRDLIADSNLGRLL